MAGLRSPRKLWQACKYASGWSVIGAASALGLLFSSLFLTGCSGIAGSSASSGTPSSGIPTAVTGQPTVSLTTYHNDNGRSGLNAAETTLTPANVNQAHFGKLFALAVDGQIYGQPLYLPNVSIPGQGTHNVVYVGTQHDSVYAFDADGKTTAPLWHQSFINPGAGITTVSSASDLPVPYFDIAPEIGITSTAVIDSSSGTLYVVAKTKENGEFFQRLHALDVATGAEKFGGPAVITASAPGGGVKSDGNGNVVFDPLINLQRSGLLLLNGVVYVAFASEGDFDPFHGWILGYDAHTLRQTIVYCPTADGSGGSVWESGNGPAADAAGNIFVGVANGDYSVPDGGRDFGNSFVRLTRGNGTLQVADWFTPFDFQELADQDLDVGSGGPILLPDQGSGAAHLLIGGNKAGQLYVMNRDSMGHSQTDSNNQIVQQLDLEGPLFGTPAAWQNNVYIAPVGASLRLYKINGGQLAAASQAPQRFGFPGSSPAVSSNGNTNAIVWALQVDKWDAGPAILHAYDANDVSHELYNSAQAGDRDTAGTAVKFTVPSVVNGKVYVGGGGQLTVYGLLP